MNAQERLRLVNKYLTHPTDEEWEQLKLRMYWEAQAHGAQGGFPITSVDRDDLASIGFDTSKVTDDVMAEIRDHMADAYCDDPFWVELETIAEDMGIPRNDGSCE